MAVEQIVVTGSRIVLDGYSAPTPVSVISPDQFRNVATDNLADYLHTIPQITNSRSSASTSQLGSSSGINSANLRGLGNNRTLILLDGRRTVASNVIGEVDIATFPQQLVSRVDVVTAGASASYGSDAVAGVVNFILDKEYTGFKATAEGGVTGYGDGDWWEVSATAGQPFADGRGHWTVSAELSNRYGIFGIPREWNNHGHYLLNNPAYTPTNGQPQLINRANAGYIVGAPGGIITNTALRGTYFGPGGTPLRFNYGAVSDTNFTVGGDWALTQNNDHGSLDPELMRNNVYTRVSFDVTDNVTAWAEYGRAETEVTSNIFRFAHLANLTIRADNAFLPASVAQQAASLGITQFTMGKFNEDLGVVQINTDRQVRRYAAGFDGSFNLFNTDWGWNAYYQRSTANTYVQYPGFPHQARFLQSIDAARDNFGRIVCRSTLTNPNDGCVPYNIFGTGVQAAGTASALENWFMKPFGFYPGLYIAMKQELAAVSGHGEPFSSWAGPVSVAYGAEWRRESLVQQGDPLARTNAWYVVNAPRVEGSYSVTEGFLETAVPLLRSVAFADAVDLNAAVRATDYSTSGWVTTWKAGATWDIPGGIRLRGTRSRDIRAPNNSEIYSGGSVGSATPVIDRFHNNASVQGFTSFGVATGLEPEEANTTSFGVVFTPEFLPNFSASIDYFMLDLEGAIGTLTPQQVIDLCFTGNAQACGRISPDLRTLPAAPSQINLTAASINLSSIETSGYDVEATYRQPLSSLVASWSGELVLRALYTRSIEQVTDTGLSPPTDNTGSLIPEDRYNISLGYRFDRGSTFLTARGLSSTVYNTSFIECTTGCPTSTTFAQTIDNNHIPGAVYYDLSANYRLFDTSSTQVEIDFSIQNLLDKDPAIVAGTATGNPTLQTQVSKFDILGRRFRLGFSVRM